MDDRQPRCVRGRRAPDAARHEAARAPRLRGDRTGAGRRVRAAAHLAARCRGGRARDRVRALDPAARHRALVPARRARAAARAHRHGRRRPRAPLLHALLRRRRAGARPVRRAAARLRGRDARPRHLRRRVPAVHVLGGDERALVPPHRPLHRPEGEPRRGPAGAHRHDVRRPRDARRPRGARRRRRHELARRAHRPAGHGPGGRMGHRAGARRRDLEERARAVPLLAARPRWPRPPRSPRTCTPPRW